MNRIVIDRSLCSGFGACAELAPRPVRARRRRRRSLRQSALTDDPAAHDAAAACPMGAITVVEERAA